MGLSYLGGGRAHRCLLAFTSALLLCEIVIGRLCNSLTNMVDSFHTLYVLIHITLRPYKIPSGAPGSSITNPYLSSNPNNPQTDAPKLQAVGSTDIASPTADPSAVSEEGGYSMLRVQPFGGLISGLLLASLCISITLEILSRVVQPHSVQNPVLATAIGAVSVLFNAGMVVWRGCRWMRGVDEACKDEKEKPNDILRTSDDKATLSKLGEGAITDIDVTDPHSPDGTLIFCNPGASIVPNRELCVEQSCRSSLSSPDQSNHVLNSVSHDSTNHHQPQQAPQLTEQLNVEANYNVFESQSASVSLTPSRAHFNNHMSSKLGKYCGCLEVVATLTQSLLSPVLVVLNGLVLLVLGPDCLQHHWTCHLLMYLDPGFSMLAVVVLLAVTLPELRRHGLVLLQATPAQVCPEELASRIRNVPGVLAVHELHVWQHSQACLVASVHVQCPSGLGVPESSELLAAVAKVLGAFGVTYSTVQLEFLDACSNSATSGALQEPGVMATLSQTGCALRCGKECSKKMCCSPPEENSSCTAPSAVDIEVGHQDVIENTHL